MNLWSYLIVWMGLSHHYPMIIAIKPYKSIDFTWDWMHHSDTSSLLRLSALQPYMGLSPQFPQLHLPTYPLSVAAPNQWWASSTPQKRSDLKMGRLFGCQMLPEGSHGWVLSGWWCTYPSEKYESQLRVLFPIYGKIKNVPNHQPDCCWFYSCTWLDKYGSKDFEREKPWKNIMSLKKNFCLSSKNLLGNPQKIGRPHRLTLLPAYSQDVGGGKCCDTTWDWDLKGHDILPEPLLGMGQNHSKPFKTHINPKIAGTWIFNLPKILD